MIEFKLLVLLVLANGTPVMVQWFLGSKYAFPIDTHFNFVDGKRIFGDSKTLRGVFSSIVVTMLAAVILNFAWTFGLIIALFSMLGDLLSSFIKRRLNLLPSSRALGLDQIPEALLPLIIIKSQLSLSWSSVVGVVAVFFVGSIIVSRILFKLHIREQPY